MHGSAGSSRPGSSGAARAAVGIADQLLYSLTNFILTILVARYSDPTEFGTYSIMVATFLIASAVNRGLTSEPLVIRFSAASRRERDDAVVAGALLAFVVGLVGGCVLALVSRFVLPEPFNELGTIFAVVMPVLFVQDFLRYAALAAGRPAVALLNDSAVAVVQATASAVAIETGHASAPVFVVVWAVAGLGGAIVGWTRLRVTVRRAGVRPLAQRDLASRLGLDNFVTQLAQQGTGYAVGAVSGLAAAAGLRAAQTVFTPPAILSLGVQSAVTPELVRLQARSLTRMRRTLVRVALGLVTVGVLFEAAALLCPDRLGTELFGPSWLEGKPLLVYIGLAQIAGGVANAAVAGLRALADARRTLRARSIGVAITLCSVIPATIIDGARGASIALACAVFLQSVLWWAYFGAAYRDRKTSVARERVARRWQRLVDSVESPVAVSWARHEITEDRRNAIIRFDSAGALVTGHEPPAPDEPIPN